MMGERLGDWIIEAEIGHGPFGRVFRAHAADDSTRVMAVKWFVHPKAREPGFQQKFQAEMAVLRRLDHPNIVRIFDHGIHEGTPYCVSDFVEGSDCETLLREGKRPSWTDTLALALQIVSALRYAHRRSVLHRGLKPTNVILVGNTARITDFGIFKLFLDEAATPSEGAYLVPELATGKPVGKRSDFYLLGVLLYRLLTGRQPFAGATVVEMIHKHCFVLPDRPQHFLPDLPDEFDRLVMKLLSKEAAQRPGSGTLLLEELERIWGELERRGIVGKRPELPRLLAEEVPEPPASDELETTEVEPEYESRRVPGSLRGVGVGLLFVFVVGVLIWAFFFRGPDAEELYEKGSALLQSTNPADWERAWHEYFEPLTRKYPGRYEAEAKDARLRTEDQVELRRAFTSVRSNQVQSEAERFWHAGVRLCQAREYPAARLVWENLIRAFGLVEKEQRWVRLAKFGIARLDEPGESVPPPKIDPAIRAREGIGAALAEAERLRAAGDSAGADAIRAALERLYRDDPDPGVREMLKKE